MTYPGSQTERTKHISPIPEESQVQTYHNMAYTTHYGYSTTMKNTTTKTTTAHIPHIIWNNNSDSRAEWQLTARPHESPKYASINSSKQF